MGAKDNEQKVVESNKKITYNHTFDDVSCIGDLENGCFIIFFESFLNLEDKGTTVSR